MGLKHFYVKQHITVAVTIIEQVSSDKQLADVFTKPVFQPVLEKTYHKIGLTGTSNDNHFL